MPTIAVSYRRSDSQAVAGRLYDRLTARYGVEQVFMDIEKIPLGIDFRAYIKSVLSRSDLLLAVVGPRWRSRWWGRSRLTNPADPVRVEIEMALEHGIRIIPVLIEGAKMPAARQLPASMADFSFLNATSVDAGRDFHLHVARLIEAIDAPRPAVPEALSAKPARVSDRTAGASGRTPDRRVSPGLMRAASAALAVAAGAALLLPLPRLFDSIVRPLPNPSDRTIVERGGMAGDPRPTGSIGGPYVPVERSYRVVSSLSDGVLNLRPQAGARADNKPIVAIPAGTPGIVLSTCRRLEDGELWCAAKWKRFSGWLNARYVIEIESGAENSAAADKLYRVLAKIPDGVLNVRPAPNTKEHNVPFASLPEGTSGIRLGPCIRIDDDGQWCLARWDQHVGWVNRRDLVDAGAEASLK